MFQFVILLYNICQEKDLLLRRGLVTINLKVLKGGREGGVREGEGNGKTKERGKREKKTRKK